MQFTYLMQGAGDQLLSQASPPGPLLVLAYDEPVHLPDARACLFDPSATWAEGRNILLDVAARVAPADYYVFCDDDVRFIAGSFASFEAWLARSRPTIRYAIGPI